MFWGTKFFNKKKTFRRVQKCRGLWRTKIISRRVPTLRTFEYISKFFVTFVFGVLNHPYFQTLREVWQKIEPRCPFIATFFDWPSHPHCPVSHSTHTREKSRQNLVSEFLQLRFFSICKISASRLNSKMIYFPLFLIPQDELFVDK